MVNFRYHLVSLIAVFTALAIGVILGAGPLQTRIADTVRPAQSGGGTVDTAELARLRQMTEAEAAGVDTLGAQVLSARLKDVPVALICLPGTNPEDLLKVRENLGLAGAKVVGSVCLTDNWDSGAKAKFRETLATSLESHLSHKPGPDVTPDGIVAHAMLDVLTTTGAERDVIQEILTDKDSPLLSLDEDPKGSASAVIVVGPRSSAPVGANASAEENEQVRSVAAWTGLAGAIALAPKGGVFIGDASEDSAMVAQVRALGVKVTTVDSVGTSVAALSAVLALSDAGPVARHYGSGVAASQVMPKIR